MRVFSLGWVLGSFFLCGLLHGDDQSWPEKMQNLSRVLPRLMVDVSKKDNFQNEDGLKRIKENTEKLVELSHKVVMAQKKGKDLPGGFDPSTGLLSEDFEGEAKRAQSAIESGHYEYGRSLILSLSSYCISCHTRSDYGPKFPVLKMDTDLDSLTPVEKADLYAATRQFDKAVSEYQKILMDKETLQDQPFVWQRAAKMVLAISVRVNNDPKKALEVLRKVPRTPSTARFVGNQLDHWISSLEEWSKDKKQIRPAKDPLKKARSLIGQAQQEQSYPADDSGGVYFLRASAELHNLMLEKLAKPQMAEVFYLTGIAYEGIDVLRSWAMPEVYYQSCIRKLPHSSMSEKCFERLEQNVYMGYTGSSGTHIPGDVKARLDKLRKEARKKSSKKSE